MRYLIHHGDAFLNLEAAVELLSLILITCHNHHTAIYRMLKILTFGNQRVMFFLLLTIQVVATTMGSVSVWFEKNSPIFELGTFA